MSGKKTPKAAKPAKELKEVKKIKAEPERREDIYEILGRAFESEDDREIEELTAQVLAVDPDNPEALLLRADIIDENEEERLFLLEKARGELERYFQEKGLSGEDIFEDEEGLGFVYIAVLQRIAYTLFTLEEDDRSLEVVRELLRYDPEDYALAKTLYYRIYLEREDWTHILEETMKETNRDLGWAYSRTIATFMLSAGGREKSAGKKDAEKTGSFVREGSLEKVDKMLWDAVRMAPNAPFYMLGYTPDPVDDSEEEEDVFHFGILYEGVWVNSRELLNWFSRATILFGLLTGRFGEESGDMEEILDALGGTTDYEDLTRKLADAPRDDETVLRVLAEGSYPAAY
ncbi:MAG: hypothetical protein LBO82_05685 [Synergistaceae bacterium]|jgi:tetratricopeptide (TPR) repeat protein|nr:hypothetical protein [Synergistaceae bacterium]